MDSKAIKKVEVLLADRLADMIKDQFKDWVTDGVKFVDCDTIFSPTWERYTRSLSDGSLTGDSFFVPDKPWNYSFIVVQDPWDTRREIPVSTEVAEKALVLGGFP